MADPVLVSTSSGDLIAYPVTVTKADGTTITGLAFANIIVGKAADDQNAAIIALLQQLVALQGGAAGGGAAPAAGSTDFSIAGNPMVGAVQ